MNPIIDFIFMTAILAFVAWRLPRMEQEIKETKERRKTEAENK